MLALQMSLEPLVHGDELRLRALCLVPLPLAAPWLCVMRTWLCGVVCSGGASKSIWEGGITFDSVKCKSPLARESEFLLDPLLKVPPALPQNLQLGWCSPRPWVEGLLLFLCFGLVQSCQCASEVLV